ncbi:MAG: M1 family aminopeptidase [Chitinophagaceae bacterium]
MKQALLLLTIQIFGVFGFSNAIAQQPDSIRKMPSQNVIRSPKIDIKNIAIDLKFDWDKKQAFGTTRITFSPIITANKITLDAGMLTLNSIELTNRTPLHFNYDGGDKNDGLEIILDRVYNPGEEVILKIDYHTNWINKIDPNNLSGTNGKGLRFSQPTMNDPIKPKEIWSFGDPESNRYWFPCYDSPNDLRTTEFTATVEKNLTIVSNGNLLEIKNNNDGTHTFQYKTTIPYANHFTSFVIGDYVDVKQKFDEVTLHNFAYPKEKLWAAATVERLPDMMKYFSKVTGIKYPYPNYSQVFVQDIGTFSGNNTVSTITENMVDDPGTHADFFYLWDLTEAEALAQQWFGNYIAPTDWSEVWLNKSFAHYFNELYNEQKNGSNEFLLYQLAFDQSAYFGDWNAGYRHPVVTQNFDNVYNFTGDNYAAYRGSLVLHMLRKQLGEEKWWKAIQLYVKNNAAKPVTTKDFIKAVEEANGENLDWFFEQWVYKMGHPIFIVTKNYEAAKKQLVLHVKQIQTVDTKDEYPQVEFFKGKIDIEIDGRIEHVWLEAKNENIFYFDSAREPKLVNFDYENTWVSEIIFEKTVDELFYQLQKSKDILARQAALNELSTIAKDEKTSIDNKTKIITAFRNIVLSSEYFRLKNLAIVQLRNLNINKENRTDEETISTLLTAIKKEKSWTLAALINSLGMTKDPKYSDLYIKLLNNKSERVISAAASALGKTKSEKAFDALTRLTKKPSMKSQSMISALNGLKELGDPRGFDIAFNALSDLNLPRWRLPNTGWDFRIYAAQTIASLGRSSDAYPLIFERFKRSLKEDDLDGMLNNILLINTLADPHGQEAFDILKVKFKNDMDVMNAVNNYETQFKKAIK